ncbi:unnamed protein product, partial [Musa banksii]
LIDFRKLQAVFQRFIFQPKRRRSRRIGTTQYDDIARFRGQFHGFAPGRPYGGRPEYHPPMCSLIIPPLIPSIWSLTLFHVVTRHALHAHTHMYEHFLLWR